MGEVAGLANSHFPRPRLSLTFGVRRLATVKAYSLTILLFVALFSADPTIAAETQPTIPNSQYSWPATLKDLPFGTRAHYRDTAFEVEVILEKDSSFLLIFQNAKLLFRHDFGLVSQFRLLETDTRYPLLAAWGDRHDNLQTRLLIGPTLDSTGRLTGYNWQYLELYTIDRSKATDATAHKVSLRPQRTMELYFCGYVGPWATQLRQQYLQSTPTYDSL